MMAWKKTGTLLAAALFVGSLVAEKAEARPARVSQIPNGTAIGCVICHVSAGGGGPRNAFGSQVEADFLTSAGFSGQVVWGPELAALDADGDGASNGLELGDPEGTWVAGDANPEGEVFGPHDPDSTPPLPEPEPEPTAVAASSWAQIKSLIGE